jgi:hypothetical protein
MRLLPRLKRLGERGNELRGELVAGDLDGEHGTLGLNSGRDPDGALFGQVVDDRVVQQEAPARITLLDDVELVGHTALMEKEKVYRSSMIPLAETGGLQVRGRRPDES